MAKANTSAEPSMEEILASIRRIISDESAPPAPKPAPAQPAPAPVVASAPPAPEPASEHMSEEDLDRLFAQGADDEPDIGVLDLVEPVAEPEPEPEPEHVETLDLVEGLAPDEADVQFVDPVPAFEPEPEPVIAPEPVPPPRPARAAVEQEPPRRAPPPPPIDDEEEEPLVSARTGASVNAAFGQLSHTILAANAKTLDDIVKEVLRPMLKTWLDDNLPVIVERLVRAEIERVSRGR